MTRHTTKELYAEFLRSDFWINLSQLKRRMVGHCQRCPATKGLQSHHVRYPDHWFDTTLDDLEVLCRDCHEKEHHVSKVVFTPNTARQARKWRAENRKRAKKAAVYQFKQTRKQRVKQRNKRERRQGLEKVRWAPWQKFRTTPKHHYVNRGTSSN